MSSDEDTRATSGPNALLKETSDQFTNEEFDVKTNAANQAWLLPKFLLDRWSSIKDSGVEIGRLRVYEQSGSQPQALTVVIPDGLAELPGTEPIPNEYDLTITNNATSNVFVFAEKRDAFVRTIPDDQEMSEASGSRSAAPSNKAKKRKREPALVAKVVHECALKPDVESKQYRQLMRSRQLKANQPKRKTLLLDESRALQSMRASGTLGLLSEAKKESFVRLKPKPSVRERLVRLPANDVRDMIFTAFEEHRYWSIKSLREQTQQPESYLKELLPDIARLNDRGPYAGLYSLLPVFQQQKKEAISAANTPVERMPDGVLDIKDEMLKDEDDDEMV